MGVIDTEKNLEPLNFRSTHPISEYSASLFILSNKQIRFLPELKPLSLQKMKVCFINLLERSPRSSPNSYFV